MSDSFLVNLVKPYLEIAVVKFVTFMQESAKDFSNEDEFHTMYDDSWGN